MKRTQLSVETANIILKTLDLRKVLVLLIDIVEKVSSLSSYFQYVITGWVRVEKP
jgi:predicted RNase H-related nuclease YkuK (DUF458 family)